MGLFSRRKPKEEDDFMDLDSLTPKRGVYGPGRAPPQDDLGAGLPGAPDMPASIQQGNSDMIKKDIEVLSSKIDALKSEIEALQHRIRLMEEKFKMKGEEASMEKYGTPSAPQTQAGWHF